MFDSKDNLTPIKPGTNELLQNYIDATRNNYNDQLVSASQALRNEIIRRFGRAIAMLYRNDRILLEHKMHEQTICGRLAIYLQRKFKDFKSYAVDVEYYLHTKKKDERQGGNKGRIRIDILFHSRGENGSRADILLAVEAKYVTNKDTGSSDKRRLKKLTTLYTIPSGASVYINDEFVGNTPLTNYKQANELGLYDMSGNVCEWCQNLFREYGKESARHEDIRTYRGGGSRDNASKCRVSSRQCYGPDYHYPFIGFRLAL